MQSVSTFWQRIIEAQLLASEEVETLQQVIASAGIGLDADAIAAWLVSQKKISRYQATRCLTGAYTSFDWADFLLVEPIDGGMLQYHWRAKHIPTGQMVILLELKGDPSADNGANWADCSTPARRFSQSTSPTSHPTRSFSTIRSGALFSSIAEEQHFLVFWPVELA